MYKRAPTIGRLVDHDDHRGVTIRQAGPERRRHCGKTSGGHDQRDDLQVLTFVQRVIHPLS